MIRGLQVTEVRDMGIDTADVVSVVGIIGLTVFGIVYIRMAPRVDPGVIMTLVAGIAGLGGYQIKQRYNNFRNKENM